MMKNRSARMGRLQSFTCRAHAHEWSSYKHRKNRSCKLGVPREAERQVRARHPLVQQLPTKRTHWYSNYHKNHSTPKGILLLALRDILSLLLGYSCERTLISPNLTDNTNNV